MADPGTEEVPETLSLHQAAAMVGTYRWTEERLFTLTGRWSGDAAMSPAVQVHLFEESRRHAQRAGEWAERLPVLAGVDPLALTQPAGAAGPLLEALEAEAAPPARLVGLYRVVLPALAATYRRHLARAVPVADRPVIRVLRAALADVQEEQEVGAALLAALLAVTDGDEAEPSPGGPQAVAAGQSPPVSVQRFEQLVAVEGAEGCLLAWPSAGSD